MPPPGSVGGAFPVRFDELLFREDLAHASASAQDVARQTRRRLEQTGIAATDLRRCDPEHRDGTRLANCVKTYLPPPAGP